MTEVVPLGRGFRMRGSNARDIGAMASLVVSPVALPLPSTSVSQSKTRMSSGQNTPATISSHSAPLSTVRPDPIDSKSGRMSLTRPSRMLWASASLSALVQIVSSRRVSMSYMRSSAMVSTSLTSSRRRSSPSGWWDMSTSSRIDRRPTTRTMTDHCRCVVGSNRL